MALDNVGNREIAVEMIDTLSDVSCNSLSGGRVFEPPLFHDWTLPDKQFPSPVTVRSRMPGKLQRDLSFVSTDFHLRVLQMTMMAHIKSVVQALQKSSSATSVVYFCGQAKEFNLARLSDDAEVLVVRTKEGCESAIRIASIDGINLVNGPRDPLTAFDVL